jgi:hypothetical protein
MTEQQTSHEGVQQLTNDLLPRWVKVALGGLFTLSALVGIWRHGFRNWDWVMSVTLIGLLLVPASMTEPLGKNFRWPLRIAFLIWVGLASAFYVHMFGWIPGIAFGTLCLTSVPKEKWVGWRNYAKKPLNLASTLLTCLLILWFAHAIGGWVPIGCVSGALLLLEGDTSARRSFIQNVRRFRIAAVLGLTAISTIWASAHISFWNIAAPVIILILLSADIYLHTSSQEEPLALSHPQS